MSVTPESVKQMLSSEDLGDRLRAVNQIRELEPAIAFELVKQPSMTAMLASGTPLSAKWIRWADRFINRFDRVARSLFNDPEPDVQAAADCLGALKLTEALKTCSNSTTPLLSGWSSSASSLHWESRRSTII